MEWWIIYWKFMAAAEQPHTTGNEECVCLCISQTDVNELEKTNRMATEC